MMVAVSKVEDDKSVIISTVDPNGLVAKYGLFKGLTLHKVCLSNWQNEHVIYVACVSGIDILMYKIKMVGS